MQTSRTTEAHFTCKHCKKVFVREHRYLAHNCKQMKRIEELKSPNGQAAWNYYQLWMRELKRMPPPANAFLTSKYFRTFVNFTNFTKKVSLPRPDRFIWLMVEKKYQPNIWTSDDVYSIYLEYLDRKQEPIDSAKISIKTLLNYATQHNIDVSTVFDTIHPNELQQFLRVRQLSPWLLVYSKKFGDFYNNKTTQEQRIILDALIQFDYWAQKKEQYKETHPVETETIKKYIGELNL